MHYCVQCVVFEVMRVSQTLKGVPLRLREDWQRSQHKEALLFGYLVFAMMFAGIMMAMGYIFAVQPAAFMRLVAVMAVMILASWFSVSFGLARLNGGRIHEHTK